MTGTNTGGTVEGAGAGGAGAGSGGAGRVGVCMGNGEGGGARTIRSTVASVRTSRRSRASRGGGTAPGGDDVVNLAISNRRSSTAAAQISGSVSIGFGPQKDVSSSILCGDGDRDTPDTTDRRPTECRLW